MVRLIALYSVPDDPDTFDEHYRNVHTPIINRYPGLREMRVSPGQMYDSGALQDALLRALIVLSALVVCAPDRTTKSVPRTPIATSGVFRRNRSFAPSAAAPPLQP